MDSTNTDMPKEDAWQAAIDYGIDVSLLEYNLSLTPEERILKHERNLELVRAMRQAAIDYHGYDPRFPEEIQ
ncbi:MAG: hypothetical protein IPK83_07635 [Planctomycetes bacterium]|nr:hypothetical protein [Planctomycetota bacterium]